MEPRRVEVWSLPDDPAGFKALLEPPVIAATLNDRDDTPGTGTIALPADYAELDTILKADPTNVSASKSTLVSVFRLDEPTIPDFEFFTEERVDPIGPGPTTISGPDIRSGLDDGKVYPRTPTDPIWLWGQPTLTRNSDLTEGTIADEEFDVWVVATAGTWRIDLGASGWSGAIAWDATNVAVKTAIEAGPSSVVEANVTGTGTALDPWKIHVVNPAQTNYSVQVDDASLTGDIFVRLISDGGEVKATYYTPAQTVDGVLFGVQGTWRVENDPLDGLPSILVAGNSAFIGVQQILEGVAGITGYATVEIRPLIYGARFRLGIRDIDEAWLFTEEADLVIGSYQTITIPMPLPGVVTIDPIYDHIILRAAVIEDAPPDFYVRNLKFHPGFPGTTIGDIILKLVGAAKTRGVLSWLDTSSFSATADSNAVVWNNDELTWRADPGMDLGTHVMGEAQEADYEYDIIRKAVPVGALTHDLLLYNPGGKGETPTIDPAVIVGDITTGQIAKRRIAFTHLLVEYQGGKTVEVTDAMFSGLPRREGFIRAEQALDEPTAIQIGEAYLAGQVDDILAVQVQPTSIDPYRDLDIGWNIPYEMGKHAGRHTRRIHTITSRLDNDRWDAELTASRLFPAGAGGGSSAEWEAIRRLQIAFDRKDRFPRQSTILAQPILPQLAGGRLTGLPFVTIAAENTRPELQEIADFVAGSGDAQNTWGQGIEALDRLGAFSGGYGSRGTIIVFDGIYPFDDFFFLDTAAGGGIEFWGDGQPVVLLNYNDADPGGGVGNALFNVPGGGSSSVEQQIRFRNICFDGNNLSNGRFMFESTLTAKPVIHIADCVFRKFKKNLIWSERGSPYKLHDSDIYSCAFSDAAFHFDAGTTSLRLIHDNTWIGSSGNMVSGFNFSDHTFIDGNFQASGTMVGNALTGVVYGTNPGF